MLNAVRFCARAALVPLHDLRTAGNDAAESQHFDGVRILLAPCPMLVDAPFNVVTGQIIGAAIEVHRILGPGLLESIYIQCLKFELAAAHLRFVTQYAVPIVYKGTALDAQYRIDLLVEDLVVVEVKSVDCLLPVHSAQVLTYMGLTGCPTGLLINFNVPKPIDGVKRLLNTRR
jgi:GxxExxY protein